MKRKIKKITLMAVIIFIFIFVIYKIYAEHNNRYKSYINSMINSSVYNTCDSLIEMNAIIEKSTEKEYILKSEIITLNSLYQKYLNSFSDYDNLCKYLRDYTFSDVDERYLFNHEFTEFYNRIERLFDINNLTEDKYLLDKLQLAEIQESFNYSSSAVKIIKGNMDYYNTFDISIMEEETEQGIMINIKQVYKEEYLKNWPENVGGQGAQVSSEGSTASSKENERDYPEKPYLTEKDSAWFLIIQELKQLNMDEKY
jgi:hypothetical protein